MPDFMRDSALKPQDGSDDALPRRALLASPLIGVATFATMAVAAVALDLPINDPDGVLGSPFILIAVVMAAFVALDVVPRALVRAGWPPRGLGRIALGTLREGWPWRRTAKVVSALLGFYLTYVGYRNLKSYLPFASDAKHDSWLLELDRAMAFGNDPAVLLHDLLGRGIAAHVLSIVYLTFLFFVPFSLGVAVVWQRRLHPGLWYVAAMNLAWVLGMASYYVLPALGPVFVAPEMFSGLSRTGVTALQESLVEHRTEVLAAPHAAEGVQSIAAFASLHVAIVFVAALIAQLLGLARAVRVTLWVFLALTIVATLYFGWHYIIDDIAGLAIGGLAVLVGATATGHELRPADRREPARVLRQRTATLT